MSLEHELSVVAAALAANTAALQTLTATLASSGIVLPHPAPSAQPAPTVAPSTAAAAPVQTAPVESTAGAPDPKTAFAQTAAIVPPPAAPAAPPTAPPAASGERDSKGMPWDGRIHASSKAKVADGSWRYKRGVDDAVIAPIEAEIRATLAAPAVAVGGAAPAFGAHPFQQPEQSAPVVAPPVAAAPVAPPPPAAPVAVPVAPATGITPPDATPAMTYATLMASLPPKIVSGELTASQMQEACEQYGVASIAALAQRPDLVPFIAAALKL